MLRDVNRRPSLRDLGPLSLVALALGVVAIAVVLIVTLLVSLGMTFPSG
jgi:hypothetical protein